MRVDLTKLLGAGLLGLFLLLPGTPHAQVYKCVDERGRTNYSDKPGPGCKAGKAGATDARPQAPAAAKPGSAPSKAKTASRPPAPEQARAQDPRTLEQRCASMRRELVRLSSRQRVASVGPKGEVKYHDDPTRDQRLAQLQQEMRVCP